MMEIKCSEKEIKGSAVCVFDGDGLKRFLCSVPSDARCYSIDEASNKNSAISTSIFAYDKTLDIVECKETVSVIEEEAFKESGIKVFSCAKIENKTVTPVSTGNLTIQRNAFLNCRDLHTVILPKIGSALRIEADAFAGCENLRTVVLSIAQNPTVSISPDAFRGCRNLALVGSVNEVVQSFAREQGFEYVCVS